MKEPLYPLKFKEVIRQYEFGGRNIPRLYPQKALPGGITIAETWEITAHADDPGTVKNGSLRGDTILAVIEQFGAELMGKATYKRYHGKFPLLLKFLDAQETLEAQIHPTDTYVKHNDLDGFGKPEAWYILEAKPDAKLYWGTKSGVTKQDFLKIGPHEQAIKNLLMKVSVKAGDVLYVPPGHVHAIGKGVVLIELQQTSDVTIGPDYLFCSGRKKEVAPKEAFKMFMEQISIEQIAEENVFLPPISYPIGRCKRTHLLATKYFAWDLLELGETWILSGGDRDEDKGRFALLTNLGGEAVVRYGTDQEERLVSGETVLIPACLSDVRIAPTTDRCTLLQSYVPDIVRDVIEPLRAQGVTNERIGALGGPCEQNDVRALL